MAWKPTYDSRNRANLAKLADNTKAAALKWYDYLIDNKIDLLIYETIRTEAQQRANVAKGASQTMKSYHLVGQALDFVPVNGKTTLWNGYGSADVKKAVAYAKKLGFEWGGDWSGFVDKPHLQFNYRGYGTDTFGKKVTNSTSKPSASSPKKSTSYPLPDGVIKVTKPLTKGTKVTQVQTALAACYFYPDKGAKNNGIDGYYGPKTANAVKRFQLMNGLSADGIYGPKTKAKLATKLK